MNNKLSLAIPTYNRPEILIEGLEQILKDLINLQIPVYISDDSSNDLTNIAIEAFRNDYYPHIFYTKNSPSLGHDLNFLQTIKMPETEYVWYLGDSTIIYEGTFERVLKTIHDDSPDLIAVYSSNRVVDLPLSSKRIYKANELMINIGWHLTMTGVTIYRKKAVDAVNISVDKFKNFPQLAMIIEIMLQVDGSCMSWINERLLGANSKKISYWSSSIFSVFIRDLENLFNNLSQPVAIDIRNRVLSDHARYSGIFSLKNLLVLRFVGYFTRKEYLNFGVEIAKYAGHFKILVFFICIVPVPLLKKLIKLKKSFYK